MTQKSSGVRCYRSFRDNFDTLIDITRPTLPLHTTQAGFELPGADAVAGSPETLVDDVGVAETEFSRMVRQLVLNRLTTDVVLGLDFRRLAQVDGLRPTVSVLRHGECPGGIHRCPRPQGVGSNCSITSAGSVAIKVSLRSHVSDETDSWRDVSTGRCNLSNAARDGCRMSRRFHSAASRGWRRDHGVGRPIRSNGGLETRYFRRHSTRSRRHDPHSPELHSVRLCYPAGEP